MVRRPRERRAGPHRAPRALREGSGGIDAVCGLLDDYRVELIADFQAVFHLNILDVLSGRLDAGYALELIAGLHAYPASLFRAKWLTEHPQETQLGKPELSFFGWSQDSALLLRIHNLLAGQSAGSDKKLRRELMLDGPTAKRKPQLFARTIAEFDTDRFMGVIASGKL